MSETAYRDVVARIRVEPHPDNAKQFSDFARNIAKAKDSGQRQADQAVKKSLQQQNIGIKQHVEQSTKATNDVHANRIKKETAWQKTLEKSRAADRRQTVEIEKQRTAYAASMRTISTQNDQIAEAGARALTGIMSITRGMAMMGLVSEENTAKLLRQVIKLQATFDVMRGGLDMIVATKKAWQGYVAVIESANVAKAAHAAISIGGGAVGGGARGIGSNVVSGAAGGAAVKFAPGVVGGAATWAAAISAAILGALAGGTVAASGASSISKGYGLKGGKGSILEKVGGWEAAAADWAGGLVEMTDKMGAAARVWSWAPKQILNWLSGDRSVSRTGARGERQGRRYLADQAEFERTDQQASVELSRKRAMRDARRSMGDPTESELQGRLSGAQGRLAKWSDPSLSAHTPGLAAQKGGALGDVLDAQKSLLGMARQEQKIAQDTASKKIAAARESLRISKASLDQEKQKYNLQKQQYMTAKERFGMASKADQREMIRVTEKARRGETLTKAETGVLAGVGLDETGKMARSSMGKMAEAAKWSTIGGTEKTRLAKMKEGIDQRYVKLDAGIKIDHGITVKLDSDIGALSKKAGDAIAAQLRPAMQRMTKGIMQTLLAELRHKYDVLDTQAEMKVTAISVAGGN